MKTGLSVIIIAIVLLFGCSDPYENGGLVVEVAPDGYFVRGEKIDDVDAFFSSLRNPGLIELHIMISPDAKASSAFLVIDSAKEYGFKDLNVAVW